MYGTRPIYLKIVSNVVMLNVFEIDGRLVVIGSDYPLEYVENQNQNNPHLKRCLIIM